MLVGAQRPSCCRQGAKCVVRIVCLYCSGRNHEWRAIYCIRVHIHGFAQDGTIQNLTSPLSIYRVLPFLSVANQLSCVAYGFTVISPSIFQGNSYEGRRYWSGPFGTGYVKILAASRRVSWLRASGGRPFRVPTKGWWYILCQSIRRSRGTMRPQDVRGAANTKYSLCHLNSLRHSPTFDTRMVATFSLQPTTSRTWNGIAHILTYGRT